MRNNEIRNLIGGFATDTLTARERQILYTAALEDQELFDALAEEQTLRDYLADPVSRQRIAALLRERGPVAAGRVAWWRLGAVAFATIVGIVVIRTAQPPAARQETAMRSAPAVIEEAPAGGMESRRDAASAPAAPPPAAVAARAPSLSVPAPQRMKVAVLDFAASGPAEQKEADAASPDLGKTASDLLAQNLDPNLYSVIDRRQVDALLQANSFREREIDPAAAVELGRQLGADAVIVGAVQVAQLPPPPPAPAARAQAPSQAAEAPRQEQQLAKAAVAEQIEVRATAIGTQSRARVGFGQAQQANGMGLTRAVGQVASSLNQQMRLNIAPRIEAQVTDVNATILTLNAGALSGVKIGDRLPVRRSGRVIGRVVINSVEDTYSVGTYEGPEAPRVGDAVSNQLP